MTMPTTTILYWRRTIEVAMLLGALVVIGIFWHNAPPAVVPVLLGLIGTALATGQSPMGNPTTTIRTMHPPPMPPLPSIHTPTDEEEVTRR